MMTWGRRQVLVAALGLWACQVAGVQAAESDSVSERKYIRAGTLFDARTGRVASDRLITIEGDRVTAVEKWPGKLAADADLTDLSDYFVLPGLMDMHVHLMGTLDRYFFAGYFQSPHRAVIGGVVNAERTLMAGFTTVRNVGAADYQDVALRNAIDAGEVPGPRMAVSGPPLGITGGHCDRNALNHRFEERGDGVADGPWAARAQVRKNVKYGVDLIKLCATGGVFSKGTQVGQTQYTLEEMRNIVEEAHVHGRTVAAHAHGNEGIRLAIEAGVDSVEHISFLDESTALLAKQRGTYLAPDIYNTEYTLAQGEQNGVPQENIDKERMVGERQREAFAIAVRAGAKVVFATDAGVYPHGDNGKQFSRMVKLGMTEPQALQAATWLPAPLLKRDGELGRVAPGYYAEVIAVKGNPREDISELEDVDFVLKGGVVFKVQ
mgnify:CR=1 FL=1